MKYRGLKWSGLGVLVCAFMAIFASPTAGAYSTSFFPSNYVGNKTIDLTVGQTEYVRNSKVDVYAYFTDNTTNKTLTVTSFDYCPASPGLDYAYPKTYPNEAFSHNPKWGSVATHFTVGGTAYDGLVRKAGGCDRFNRNANGKNGDNNRKITIPASVLNYDADTGLYRVRITATHNDLYGGEWDGIVDGFRLNISGSGAKYISTVAGGNGYDVTMVRHDSSASKNNNYTIPFGSNCDVTSNVTKRMSFYDLDNGGGSGAQEGGNITVRLYGHKGNDPEVLVPFTAKNNGSFNNPKTVWTPGELDNASQWVEFTAKPNYKYKLVLSNVYYNNTVQYSLPFDGVYWHTQCANDYELTPSVGISDNTVEAGQQVTASSSVKNDGPTRSKDTAWRLHQLVFVPGVNPTPASGATSNSAACAYFSAAANCTLVSGDHRSFSASPAVTNLPDRNRTVGNIAAGSKICFVLSVKPWKVRPGQSGGSNWRYSDLACAVVAKKPKLHVLDGDLRVQGSITTSTSRINGQTYGSWVDYGVFSTSLNKLTASGGGLRGGNTSNLSTDWSKLTFANTPALGNFTLGTFSSAHDYFANVTPTQTASSSLTLSGTGRHVIDAGTDVTIQAGTIPIGGTFIVKATGTVTIAGDIRYDTIGSITAAKDIPQVVIVAHDIKIHSSVRRIDAWLLSTGEINTCSDGPAGTLTINDCKQALTVNGPVSVNTLHVRRTAGATAVSPRSAAETFRLTPYTYLWAREFTGFKDRVQTVYITEEPPRF
jgi:hypothetical protein